ncbi:hypothetical protein [Kribbella sp. VKM Ac-2568]|uniref:hypothetical protein n=1 Tax=Kribbella sp. VKM Ac-2568 TaxID=2512219 RepID=UPI0010494F47|nr:hypothetical protein [Kribbella sp. VKM Ac-2568]TCM47149.1 hypothetical protein EV648_105630 [Kribbella sp. VKM Ac-2568]
MTPAERRELILRLALVPAGLLPAPRTMERIRRWRLALMLACVAALIPWTVYLAVTLPSHYEARNWVATWVGFDVILLAMLVATAVFGWRRRLLLFPAAFASGVLLVCDAWFDVLTSQRGADLVQALLTAFLVELPLAFILIAGPLRLLRYVAIRNGLVGAGVPMWRMPIPMPELWPQRRIPPG